MQALLIATGETQKLKLLTERAPSPLLPVLNRPIMLYNLELLGRLGIKRILVSVHTMASAIEQYFGDGCRWGLSLEYILLREPLGSAGVLWRAKQFLKEQFLVMPADEIVDLELAQAIQQHVDQCSPATVVVVSGFRDNKRTLITDTGRRILAVGDGHENSTPSWINTGVYLFDPMILSLVPPRQAIEIHQHLLPILLSKGIQVNACPLPGYWNPLETLQHYVEAQHVFLSKSMKGEAQSEEIISYRYHALDTRQIAPGIWAGRNIKIQADTTMIPPVSIGHNTWIEREVELGPNTIIGSNVVIDRGASIQHSMVFDHTYVGKLVNIDNRLVNQDQLVDLCTNDHIRVKNANLLGKVGTQYTFLVLRRFIDCVLALLLLLISLPFSLILALLLLFSTGQIFTPVPCQFPHACVGRKKETYHLLHFTTRRKDGRRMWLGLWLESWEGERLPELLNVLKGDLAMVGIKPVMAGIETHKQLEPQPGQEGVLAGCTGLWYLQADDMNGAEETEVADAYYLATRNWKSDWRILWSTPSVWCRRTRIRSDGLRNILGGDRWKGEISHREK